MVVDRSIKRVDDPEIGLPARLETPLFGQHGMAGEARPEDAEDFLLARPVQPQLQVVRKLLVDLRGPPEAARGSALPAAMAASRATLRRSRCQGLVVMAHTFP